MNKVSYKSFDKFSKAIKNKNIKDTFTLNFERAFTISDYLTTVEFIYDAPEKDLRIVMSVILNCSRNTFLQNFNSHINYVAIANERKLIKELKTLNRISKRVRSLQSL